jgi:hypothetical protein
VQYHRQGWEAHFRSGEDHCRSIANNAWDACRDSAYFPDPLQPIKIPSHYDFLLITGEMASSLFR